MTRSLCHPAWEQQFSLPLTSSAFAPQHSHPTPAMSARINWQGAPPGPPRPRFPSPSLGSQNVAKAATPAPRRSRLRRSRAPAEPAIRLLGWLSRHWRSAVPPEGSGNGGTTGAGFAAILPLQWRTPRRRLANIQVLADPRPPTFLGTVECGKNRG